MKVKTALLVEKITEFLAVREAKMAEIVAKDEAAKKATEKAEKALMAFVKANLDLDTLETFSHGWRDEPAKFTVTVAESKRARANELAKAVVEADQTSNPATWERRNLEQEIAQAKEDLALLAISAEASTTVGGRSNGYNLYFSS